MKKLAVVLFAIVYSVPSFAQGTFFGEERSVKYTVAADYANTNVSFSDTDAAVANQDFKSDMANIKLGLRPEAFVGRKSFLTVELHIGAGLRDDEEPGDIETSTYYGAYLVPHAVVFDRFELSFPIGYARNEFTKNGEDVEYDSVAFGGNVMLPLRLFFAEAPDIRFSAGGQVYHQSSELRVYGYNVGLRWDF